MRFTDNAELTAANMANADILAGTDVSASTDKKFTLSGLADWFLNRFTGLSLAGKNQSVKAALDELNSTTTWKNVALTAGNNVTIQDQKAYECGGILFIFCRWQATATLESYQAVLNTGKAAKMAWNAPLMKNDNVPVPGYGLYADVGNGSVRATGTIPAGTYRTYLVIPIA